MWSLQGVLQLENLSIIFSFCSSSSMILMIHLIKWKSNEMKSTYKMNKMKIVQLQWTKWMPYILFCLSVQCIINTIQMTFSFVPLAPPPPPSSIFFVPFSIEFKSFKKRSSKERKSLNELQKLTNKTKPKYLNHVYIWYCCFSCCHQM